LLKNNPELFLKTYGRYYISEITYGGSFLGVINLYGKTSKEDQALNVFAGFNVNDIFYNVGVSESFQN
jgi:hypothetical protein